MSDQSLLALRQYVDANAMWSGIDASDLYGIEITCNGQAIRGYALNRYSDSALSPAYVFGLPQGWQAVKAYICDDPCDGLTDPHINRDTDILTSMNVEEHVFKWVDPRDCEYADTTLEHDTSDYMPIPVIDDLQLNTGQAMVR